MSKLTFQSGGLEELAAYLRRLGEASEEALERAGEDVRRQFHLDQREVFDTEGASNASGRWRRVKGKVLVRKLRLGFSSKTLQATGDLKNSLTRAGHPNEVFEVSKDGLLLGTRDPKAQWHLTAKTRRAVVDPTQQQLDRYLDLVVQQLNVDED